MNVSADRIYQTPRQIAPFEFNEEVVRVFPDMIARSVPGYAAMLLTVEQIAARFGRPETNAYDLGCSLGAATLRIAAGGPPGLRVVGIDNSAAMVEQLRSELSQQDASGIVIEEADILGFAMENASLVVLNLTLQFIPLDEREPLLKEIFEALHPGGALLLSEKIAFEDPAQQALITEMHHDFKRANGYSDLEIAQKRTALENTLIPETMAAHIERLHRVGFEQAVPWFQCFNFVSLLAVKPE